jgi:hypothetical protein
MRVKALFLLFTFLLNSAVGLNCALQKDDDCCKEVTELSSVSNDKGLVAQAELTQEDACCQQAVNTFASLAKLLPQPVKSVLPVSTAVIQSNYTNYYTVASVVKTAQIIFNDQRRRPPTPDIRTVIQSFQI